MDVHVGMHAGIAVGVDVRIYTGRYVRVDLGIYERICGDLCGIYVGN